MNIRLNKLSPHDFYYFFVKSINLVYANNKEKALTDAEARALGYFLTLPWKKFKYQMFSSLARTKVLQSMAAQGWDISRVNLNNKIYALIAKGFCYRDEDKIIHLNKVLVDNLNKIEETKQFGIAYNITLDDEESKQETNNS